MELTIGKDRLRIASLYRSPLDHNIHDFLENLDKYLTKIKPSCTFFIMGADFNINIFEQDAKTLAFKNLIDSHGLQIIISSPTRITDTSETCIDNFITNCFTTKAGTIQPHVSDHHAIIMELTVKDLDKNNGVTQVTRKMAPENILELRHRLRREDWEAVFQSPNPSIQYQSFVEIFGYYLDISKNKICNKKQTGRVMGKSGS